MLGDGERYFVVGPGPIDLRDWAGDPYPGAVPHGLYAVAWDDGAGPRLLNGSLYRTQRDASEALAWATASD